MSIITPQEIEDYYITPFEGLGFDDPELSYGMLFPHDPPSTSYPSRNDNEEKALIRGANALFRLAYCDIIFTSVACSHKKENKESSKRYSLIRCIEMVMHQHNPLYMQRIFEIWLGDQAHITDEGQKFYNENQDNPLEALTKRFEDYGVGFEKGHLLKSPPTPPTQAPITFF